MENLTKGIFFTLFPVLCAALCAPACHAPDDDSFEDGVQTARQSIVNGTREPQTVALSEGQKLAIGWLQQTGSRGGNFCTATLVAPRVIITASHCTSGWSASWMSFGIGLEPSNPTATFQIESINDHNSVDASVLILQEDAVARVPALVPIPINTSTLSSSLAGSPVQAGGYGETRDASRSGRWFATVTLESVGQSYLGVNGNGIQGICFGDSGSGLISTLSDGSPVVLAVESNGDSSCVGRDNMTRLDVLQSWLDSVAGGLWQGGGGNVDPGEGDGGNTTPPTDPCEGVDYLGECSGNIARWCENSQIRQVDCGGQNQYCAFINSDVGYYCTSTPPDGGGDNGNQQEDPPVVERPDCNNSDNLCDGSTRFACVNGNLVTEDCGSLGAVCTFNDGGDPICRDLNTGEDLSDPGTIPDNTNPGTTDPGTTNPGDGGLVTDNSTPGGGAWSDEDSNQFHGDSSWEDDPARFEDDAVDTEIKDGCQVASGSTNTSWSAFALLAFGLLFARRRRTN